MEFIICYNNNTLSVRSISFLFYTLKYDTHANELIYAPFNNVYKHNSTLGVSVLNNCIITFLPL